MTPLYCPFDIVLKRECIDIVNITVVDTTVSKPANEQSDPHYRVINPNQEQGREQVPSFGITGIDRTRRSHYGTPPLRQTM